MGKQETPDFDTQTPVLVCSYCYRIHHTDTTGFESHRLKRWFCTNTCYQINRYFSGDAKFMDPVFADELYRLKKTYFSDGLIAWRKRRLREQVAQKRIKQVTRTTNGIVIPSA